MQNFNGVHFAVVTILFFVGCWLLFRKMDKLKQRGRDEIT